MKFLYLLDRARTPQASLAGGVQRPRPVIAVGVFGPIGSYLIDGHLDTASDDTVFPLWVSAFLGLDPSQGAEQEVRLAGRVQPVRARILRVELRITDGQESCQWPALVGFVPIPLRRALLGYAGCLQFFDANLRGADREVILTPNWSFQGQHA